MATHYHGSKGPVEIAKMPYPHLSAAHAKLVREREDDSRDGEIAAMGERIAIMDAEYAAQQEAAATASAEFAAQQEGPPHAG